MLKLCTYLPGKDHRPGDDQPRAGAQECRAEPDHEGAGGHLQGQHGRQGRRDQAPPGTSLIQRVFLASFLLALGSTNVQSCKVYLVSHNRERDVVVINCCGR